MLSRKKPSSKTVDETLALMMLAGQGKSEVFKLLEEVREVQKSNENIILEGQKTLEAAEKARSDADKKMGQITADLSALNTLRKQFEEFSNTRESELRDREQGLNVREKALEANQKAFEESRDKDGRELRERSQVLDDRLSSLEKREVKFSEEQAVFSRRQAKINELLGKLSQV